VRGGECGRNTSVNNLTILYWYFEKQLVSYLNSFLGKQQFVESRQQQDLLASDHKTQLRDFNAKKANDEKRLQLSIKEYKKDNRKTKSKAQLEAYGVQQKSMMMIIDC
jgi:hypothetical protein